MDAATLRMLEVLFRREVTCDLLVICAYRSDEVGADHPLREAIGRISARKTVLYDIRLEPLSIDGLTDLVTGTLTCEHAEARPLAQYLNDKTGGNPYFAVQLLRSLHQISLLNYDECDARWKWDLQGIEQRNVTDDVVRLIDDTLKRLPLETRQTLIDLACIGDRAEIELISRIRKTSADVLRSGLQAAVRWGLVSIETDEIAFAHDRVSEAAYSLVPPGEHARTHLRIARSISEAFPTVEHDRHLFIVVSQFNSGVSLLTDSGERRVVVLLNQRAAQKAKASGSYASACGYLAAAMGLMNLDAWDQDYSVVARLWLERAECEFLDGRFEIAEELIDVLLRRLKTDVEFVNACRLQVELFVAKGKHDLAIEHGLAGLTRLGVYIRCRPTDQQTNEEFEAVFRALGARPVNALADLPLMDEPEAEAIVNLLLAILTPAMYTNLNLTSAVLCRMVCISCVKGNSGATTIAYSWFGIFLGHVYHRYAEGYGFCQLAGALVEKYDLATYRSRIYLSMEIASIWTQPITKALRYLEVGFRSGVESGDLMFACYSRNHTVTNLLLRGDSLEEVWQETLRGIEFARRSNYQDVVDVITFQQRFVLNMQGRTISFSSFSGDGFDEQTFERDLDNDRARTLMCWYSIIKLEARVLSGDQGVAIDARNRAADLLFSSPGQIQLLSYHYFGALAITSAWDGGLLEGGRDAWRERLDTHAAQLREWAAHGSSTFADKYELIVAETLRIEGRQLEAMHWYEKAIRSAQDNGFFHTQGVACEAAGRFYLSCGLETNGIAHLREARRCFARWGAEGKVRQMNVRYPQLLLLNDGNPELPAGPALQELDMTTVVKASQALSGQTEMPKLIERLMTITLHNAGADRGLLVLPHRGGYEIVAEVRATEEGIVLTQEAIAPASGPQSLIRYVMRTRKSVLVDDATRAGEFSSDPYFNGRGVRSVFCLPISRQGGLDAVLYLENRMSSHAFTAERALVLELLAAQAAISLEITRLYGDLRDREARIRRLVESNIVGIFIWEDANLITDANDAFLRLVGYGRDELESGWLTISELTPLEWEGHDAVALEQLKQAGSVQPYETAYRHRDGGHVPVLVGAATFERGTEQGVAFVLDLTERKRAEREAGESERRYRDVQNELAHANRVATMGQLSASIAHEVRQPVSAVLMNAEAARLWLGATPPNIGEALDALHHISEDGERAAEVINRLRAFFKKEAPRRERVDLNAAITEVLVLVHSEMSRYEVKLTTELEGNLPEIEGDRVQLQQLVLNLLVNAIEALAQVEANERAVRIATQLSEHDEIMLTVSDTGPGISAAASERIFEAFHTTKPNGMVAVRKVAVQRGSASRMGYTAILRSRQRQLKSIPGHTRGCFWRVDDTAGEDP
eukprot:XP_015584090.1 uncharacterized protein LOC107262508 [Ricinus communis]